MSLCWGLSNIYELIRPVQWHIPFSKTRTSRTTRKPLFHDPHESYESYESCTCIYTLSLSNDVHFTNCTSRKPLSHDPFDSYESYWSWNNGLRVVQLVKCISLERLRVYIQVHDSYDSYGSWNNGLRVVQFVNCMSLEGLSRFENEEYSSCFASCLSSVRKYLCSSPIVRLVNHCFTTFTGRASRVKPFTGRICSTYSIGQGWRRLCSTGCHRLIESKVASSHFYSWGFFLISCRTKCSSAWCQREVPAEHQNGVILYYTVTYSRAYYSRFPLPSFPTNSG